MSVLAFVVVVALLIPIVAIVVDSPIGRALARRLEGPVALPPDVAQLAKKLELLEAEVEGLARSVQSLQDENAFLQRLLENGGTRTTLPPPPSP